MLQKWDRTPLCGLPPNTYYPLVRPHGDMMVVIEFECLTQTGEFPMLGDLINDEMGRTSMVATVRLGSTECAQKSYPTRHRAIEKGGQ
jgi:hypothetical protein